MLHTMRCTAIVDRVQTAQPGSTRYCATRRITAWR